MSNIRRLKHRIQEYAWGSHTAIPDLLGLPSPADTPCAELWMGAHPKAPSLVYDQGQWLPLNDFINAAPEKVLGRTVSERFSGQLPFLFKVLAAANPLSVQAHPDCDQAREGFERENRAGIDLTAPNRNYKDANHKPECLCALTPFVGLCGFRPPPEILDYCSRINRRANQQHRAGEMTRLCRLLQDAPDASGVKRFFEGLLTLPVSRAQGMVTELMPYVEAGADRDPVFKWMVRLSRQYPGDIGVLAPILLNLVVLAPGQAIFLPARVLHAYLDGTGIELMANSDNVLRGGLTPKHIDVRELLRVLDFSPRLPDILTPVTIHGCEQTYPSAADEFVLSVVTVSSANQCRFKSRGAVEILLCVEGQAAIEESETAASPIALNKGESVLVSGTTGPYRITGRAVIYKATVPA
jgi:mannose-6-phosphate isomerase